jgi:hypothetical protein
MRHPDLEARLAPLAYPGAHEERHDESHQALRTDVGAFDRHPAAAVEDSVMKELVPTGKLRVAIAVSPRESLVLPVAKRP